MIRETVFMMRDFGRLREIARIFIRYGWGDAVKRLGLSNVLGRANRLLHPQDALEVMHLPPEVRVRLAMEELGPTFVKLGQVLATRSDLFPPNWIAEFARLQDMVPPVPFDALLPELTATLGTSPFEIFRELDTQAIAGASIAQVHTARLQDGTPVVLKIRRPNIRARIDADLRLLSHFGRLLEAEMPELRRFQPGKIIGQFSRSLRKELDLAAEGRNTDHFARNFAGNPDVCFARIHWEYTSESLLVMEGIDGIAGNDVQQAEDAGLDRKRLAALGADTVLKMVLIDGFFHADPHPGNVFYLPGNRLAIIDCGMVGRLSVERRDQIADLLASLVSRKYETILDVLVTWADHASIDETKLAADLDEFLFNYENASLRQISFSSMLADLTTVMRENNLSIPPDLSLLFKALITLEGLGRQLDPDFQIVQHLTPFVRQVIAERYSPGVLLKRGQRGMLEAIHLAASLPRDLSRMIKEIRRGRVKIEFDLKRLDHFGHQIDHSTNRLTLGLLTSSLIIGSSIVMTVRGGPTLFGLPAFGLLGFFIASVFGLWLMLSIWRSSRED